jgi:hypothetical protein
MSGEGRPEYSVYVFLPDETHFPVVRFVRAGQAVRMAHRLTRVIEQGLVDDPDAKGVPTKVIITDGGDCTVFEWQRGRGVVFPSRSERPG